MLTAAEPQLFVTDFARSVAFFARLGFTTVFAHGEPAFYGQVARDGARLNLRHLDSPVVDPALREREELLAATIAVDSAAAIAALFREFIDAGVSFQHALRTESWGSRTFIIRDPDGNLLLFAAPGEDAR